MGVRPTPTWLHGTIELMSRQNVQPASLASMGALLRKHLEQVLDDGQRERERLARAGARAADEVAPCARGLEHVLLDGEQSADVARLQRSHRLLAQAHVGHLRGRGHARVTEPHTAPVS